MNSYFSFIFNYNLSTLKKINDISAKSEKVNHLQVFWPRWFCCLPVFSYACLGLPRAPRGVMEVQDGEKQHAALVCTQGPRPPLAPRGRGRCSGHNGPAGRSRWRLSSSFSRWLFADRSACPQVRDFSVVFSALQVN